MRVRNTGSLDKVLRIDLREWSEGRLSLASFPGVQRTLSRVSQDDEASVNTGFFCQNGSQYQESWAILEQLQSAIASHGNDSSFGKGLASIELDNAGKIINATAHVPNSVFMSDTNPWVCDKGQDDPAFYDCVHAIVGSLLKSPTSNDGMNYIKELRRGRDGIRYKRFSSYGNSIYVPGSSKLADLALQLHWMWSCEVALKLESSLLSGSYDSDSNISRCMDIFSSVPRLYGQNDAITDYPQAMMLLMRARPMSSSKLMPTWRQVGDSGLIASEWQNGDRCGLRDIKPVPAYINMLSTPIASWFSNAVHGIPGLHVGHQIMSTELIRKCHDVWGSVFLYAEDISGYDVSVGPSALAFFREALVSHGIATRSWAYADAAVAHLPVMVVNGPTSDNCFLVRHRHQIVSGEQLTTAKGTIINMAAKLYAMSKYHYRSNVGMALRKCANFTDDIRSAEWGVLLKGDDVVVFTKHDIDSKSIMQGGMSDLGFKTDVEPGPIFLMNYINTDYPLTGNDYIDCPKSMTSIKTYRSHGLICKRWGNRTIFVEHPITDQWVAALATYSNLIDTQKHPLGSVLADHLLNRLKVNAEDSVIKKMASSVSSLADLIRSSIFKIRLQEYASGSAKRSAYIEDLARRFFSADGSSTSQVSDVDHDAMSPLQAALASVYMTGKSNTISSHMNEENIIDVGKTDGYSAYLRASFSQPSSAHDRRRAIINIKKVLTPN